MTKFIIIFLSIIFSFLAINITAQDDHLDVEGNVKIQGDIDISSKDDVTSLNIGSQAGMTMDYSDFRWSTFVGVAAGQKTLQDIEIRFLAPFLVQIIRTGIIILSLGIVLEI